MMACAYLRCSGRSQVDGDTWDRQTDSISNCVVTLSLTLEKSFREIAVPGKTENQRPAFQEMIAYAQGSLPVFDHIVVIVQENRTPGQFVGTGALTGGLCSGRADFEPGVDIQDWGNYGGDPQCVTPRPLGPDSCNPNHRHGHLTPMYARGSLSSCGGGADCPAPSCYAYVPKSDVAPYFQIATTYGFANYMFQTNEGPSFEAHQFLFSGTSAPNGVPSQNNYYNWFAMDNPPDNPPNDNYTNNTGCSGTDTAMYPDFVDGIENNGTTKTGSQSDPWYLPPGFDYYSFPCYEHQTLADLLGTNHITWKYYGTAEGSIWSAPTAIPISAGRSMRSTNAPIFSRAAPLPAT